MAENDRNSNEPESPAPAPSRKGLFIVVAVILLLEGVGVFFVTKMMSGVPETAMAEHGEGESTTDGGHGEPAGHGAETSGDHGGGKGGHAKTAVDDMGKKGMLEEVKVGDCRPTNRTTGRMIIIQISVSILVKGEHLEQAKALVAAKEARFRDRINFVVRSAEIEQINEAGLDTIKRRLKAEFDRVLDDSDLVQEVLIPELLQSGSGL